MICPRAGFESAVPLERHFVAAEVRWAPRYFEVGVPKRDGLELATEVHPPIDLSHGPGPAVVAATSYGKETHNGYGELGSRYGYAFLNADVGRWASPRVSGTPRL